MEVSQIALNILNSEMFNYGWIFVFLFILFAFFEDNLNHSFWDTGLGIAISMTIMIVGVLILISYIAICIGSLPAYLIAQE
ncbi:hypothetical protein AG05_004718 [Salmonella enterica subsp. enterica]|nr:hypothetical protein [Salmonella enterica subsp. enterica]